MTVSDDASTERARVPVSAVEDLIASLPGVEGARIVLEDGGALREIHVLADASRPAKAIVRDIESALRVRWGLLVDHRRVSIAQMGDVPRRPKWTRLRLQQLAVTTDPVRDRAEVSVSLVPEPPRDAFGRPVPDPEVPDVVWQGRAAGPGGGALGIRLSVEATLQALNQSLLPQHAFAVADVTRVQLGEREAVVCLLQYHAPREAGQVMTGSAVIRGEPLEAAVRAVLNGTNRIYGIAMRRQLGARSGAGAPEFDVERESE